MASHNVDGNDVVHMSSEGERENDDCVTTETSKRDDSQMTETPKRTTETNANTNEKKIDRKGNASSSKKPKLCDIENVVAHNTETKNA